jgi:hypothetical protein
MARRGSPVESGTRSFIEPTVAKPGGCQVTWKPRRRAARAF